MFNLARQANWITSKIASGDNLRWRIYPYPWSNIAEWLTQLRELKFGLRESLTGRSYQQNKGSISCQPELSSNTRTNLVVRSHVLVVVQFNKGDNVLEKSAANKDYEDVGGNTQGKRANR